METKLRGFNIGDKVKVSTQIRVELGPPNYLLLDEGNMGVIRAKGFQKEHFMVAVDLLPAGPQIALVVQLHQKDLKEIS